MRQIILDTETTGLDPSHGHRVIEIGCVEMINRRLTNRTFHVYINPERAVDPEAISVHGITDEFLADKPNFAGIASEFIDFAQGAELIAHNASFDVGFLNAELARIPGAPRMEQLMLGGVAVDTLALAREKRPGKRNSLDALCRDYKVDASERKLHGALLDAELLTHVYLAMTREQSHMFVAKEANPGGTRFESVRQLEVTGRTLIVRRASDDEKHNHERLLDAMREQHTPLWDQG
jgi:DNA polymerase III subunit epsilon